MSSPRTSFNEVSSVSAINLPPLIELAQDGSVWDKRFFQLTETIASWSEDRSRKVGCAIVSVENGILSTGYNGFPRGVENTAVRHSRLNDDKYFWFEHAERNAIYNAVRHGVTLLDTKLYVNLFPCAECVRAVIQSGISQLNCPSPNLADPYYKRSYQVALEMISETSVELRVFDL
jgi:dCMP deaminase